MTLQADLALWLSGATLGAAAVAVGGFGWGGWVTGGKAAAMADRRAESAAVAALAPVCADRFQHAADVHANQAELDRVYEWSRGEFIQKGGWASLPGTRSEQQVAAVAEACAALLPR